MPQQNIAKAKANHWQKQNIAKAKHCQSKTLPKQNIAIAKHCQSKTLPQQNIAKAKAKHWQKQNIAKGKNCQSKTYKYFYLRTLTKFVSVWTSSLKTLCLGLMDFKSKFVELGDAIDVATDSIFGT